MDQSACFVLQGGTEGSWGTCDTVLVLPYLRVSCKLACSVGGTCSDLINSTYSMIVKEILNEPKRFDL